MNAGLKRRILYAADRMGCDIDGDIITYKGKRYYVNIFDSIVEEVKDDNCQRS